ncbi:FAD-binding oxidoreductase [Lutibaculum baratangense]|uniref:Glycolate dehydrogenase, subunit GlcD n=1 Tax=Lutibaculum baratangense AMV1 TaxID=631454 RepID=V4RM84_9HYPH|nr:FAD-linked oxidase C-terminal domain-containing protein [Lutibaculum baratangense]ESR26374.1 Glycolate dehydrogenase, subunit GlcD [Lutibaculum baratangense AMV1]
MSLRMPDANPRVIARRDEIVAGLARIVGERWVISAEDELRPYETDGLTAYRQVPLAVVLPATTEEVSRVLTFLHEEGVKVIGRGAGTSLCGGSLPEADAVVVGVSRMSKVLDIDLDTRTVRVETGITNLAVTGAVDHLGFFYAPDPSSQLACTIAGNLAMNSGGAHCLKYGVTTNNVLGMTCVLMDGTVIELGGQGLDMAGYDLLGLMIGSEGQFAITTEATLRILPKAEGARPVLLGFPTSSDAGACVAKIIASGLVPVAIEFMDEPAIRICEDFAQAGYPLDVGAMLIVEVEGAPGEIDEQIAKITRVAKDAGVVHVREAKTPAEAAAIWKGRKSAFGAMGRISDYVCMDGTIPTTRLPEVLVRISEICESHGLGVANIFHAGDGNLHPLILYDINDPDQLHRAEVAGAEVLKLCVEVGGCLTGEHGVGVEKRDLMREQFTEEDLRQQVAIKDLFDPQWLLNPAKVFPLDVRDAA